MMRDYAELVKALRYYGAFEQHAKEAADAIEELLSENKAIKQSNKDAAMRNKLLCDEISRMKEKVPHWISVEERLPEESGYTIVYCADGDRRHVTFAKYQKTPKRWELTGARSYWRVLKWMPLPEPPKEVE